MVLQRPQDNDRSRIDRVQEMLYSRSASPVNRKNIRNIQKEAIQAPRDWEHEGLVEERMPDSEFKHTQHMSFLTKLLIGALGFFLLAVGIATFVFFGGGNIVSAENVDIAITGPISANGGDVVSLDIDVANRNNVLLEAVDLIVTFPAGTAAPDASTRELKEYRKILPDIQPGKSESHNVQAIIYGQENTSKDINVRVEYRVAGSNAIFRKEKTYSLLLTSSPLSLTVSGPQEVYSGQEVEYVFIVNANSQEVLRNLLLKLTYPTGFSYKSSDVKPIYDNATWKIGDMAPGSRRVIRIKGVWQGQDQDERVIRSSLGIQSTRSERLIGTEFVGTQYVVQISRPFLALNISLEGDEGGTDYTGAFNEAITGEINWFNNLDTAVAQGEIKLKISGNAFDKYSIMPEQGLYKSDTNEIIWNTQTNRELISMGAGEGGRVIFRLIPRDLSTLNAPVSNPQITLSASAKAERSSETQVSSTLESTARKVIKVASKMSLAGGSYKKEGSFINTGPVPPRADQTTTYTIVLKVYNTANNVSGARLTATLPPYVTWLGKVSPSNENVTYSKLDGNLVWDIGTIPAYTGTSKSPREIAFQVSITPSVSQIGQIPTLAEDIVVVGRDAFTGIEIETQNLEITTKTVDSALGNSDAQVQR